MITEDHQYQPTSRSIIMFVNIQSLTDTLTPCVLDSSADPPLITAATECQLSTQNHTHLSINHYTLVYYSSSQDHELIRRGGGSMLDFHNSIIWRHMTHSSLHRLGTLQDDRRTSSLHWLELSSKWSYQLKTKFSSLVWHTSHHHLTQTL